MLGIRSPKVRTECSHPDAPLTIHVDPSSRASTLVRLQQSMTTQLDKVGSDHKEVYGALNRYGKALDKVPTCLSGHRRAEPV
jgi:hypothetical protein